MPFSWKHAKSLKWWGLWIYWWGGVGFCMGGMQVTIPPSLDPQGHCTLLPSTPTLGLFNRALHGAKGWSTKSHTTASSSLS